VPEFRIDFTPADFGRGPFGCKGMGETPILAIAPAIVSALADAIGHRPSNIPVLPEHLLGKLPKE